jgi:putative transposase
MRWMHRVRLYPANAQEARLAYMLHVTRRLYNAALQQRRDAWKFRGITVSGSQQYAELTVLRREDLGLNL